MADFPQMVTSIVDQLQVSELLHYQCGDMSFLQALTPASDLRCQVYDASIPELSDDPVASEMVVALDVDSEDTLDHLQSLTQKVLFCTVDSDYGISFWLPLFWGRFDIQTYQYLGNGRFYVIAGAINDHPKLQ